MLDKLRQKQEEFLTVAEIAPILGANPQSIRSQAQCNPQMLGFPVCVIGKRIRIPKTAFLNWLGKEDKEF